MKLLRFADLRGDNGDPPIVKTWTTLNKWIDERDFPAGHLVGRHRVWLESEIEKWVLAQPTVKSESALRGATKKYKADRPSNGGPRS